MLDSALGWIGQIAEFIGQFFPRWLVLDTTEGAIKYTARLWHGGVSVTVCAAGFVFWWPVRSKIVHYPTARQAEELRGQTINTKDDRTIIAGGLIVYEVADLEALVAHTYQPQQTIRDITLTAVHDVLCRQDWADIQDEQRRGTLDTKLKNEAKRALDPYGVRVLKLMLTDLAPCRVIRLAQSMAKGED